MQASVMLILGEGDNDSQTCAPTETLRVSNASLLPSILPVVQVDGVLIGVIMTRGETCAFTERSLHDHQRNVPQR